MRKEFLLPPIQHYATLFVSGIGYHHVYLNGEKVGDHQMDPGWTDFEKRVWYSTYDVTRMLQREGTDSSDVPPAHVLSVMLGNGWWSCGTPPGTGLPGCSSVDPPQLILQLHVDGKPVVLSDTSWQVSVNSSPIQYNSLYNGESYDARIAERIDGWQLPGFDEASSWSTASLADSKASKAKLASQLFEPIRHIATRAPVSITVAQNSKGMRGNGSAISQTLDFGQNQAAVVRLKKIFCPRDTTITMRHAEVLMHPPFGDYDGTSIYVDNLRKAEATDRYVCRGDPEGESYTPFFTQHGFRYVEITGLDYLLQHSDVEAVEMHTDVKQISTIQFSDPLLNQIQNIVMWGLKSNLMSVQTDCPQRDERRGWMGDAALTAEATALSFGMGAFYTHWLDQMIDAQNPVNGSMPNFVPSLGTTNGAPNWQTAYIMIIWVMLTHYGDLQILVRHHESMVRFFDYFEMNYNETGLANFISAYGDWCPPPPHSKSNGHLMSSFAFMNHVKIGMELFQNSPHPDAHNQLRRLRDLFAKATPEYHTAFFNHTSKLYMSGMQTEQALSLYLGVIPDKYTPSVFMQLIEDIIVNNGLHMTTGIVGTKYLMEVLSLLDRGDVAMDLALQTTYPSWGYMLHNKYEPATTVWELWNSDTGNPGMNSRNHHMFGSVSGWFYKYVAGITPSMPGFSQFQIKPNVLRLDNVSATVDSPHGHISLNYSKKGNSLFIYDIVLPSGTSATFLVPVAIDDEPMEKNMDGKLTEISILESGIPVWMADKFVADRPGIKHGRQIGKHVQLKLTGAGLYKFEVQVHERKVLVIG
jgi:alpha-L-rhamnosidase